MDKNKTVKKDKKVLTLFLLMFPALLLAMSSSIPTLYVRWAFQILLLIFQFALLKNLLDDYYGEDDVKR